MIKPDIDIVWHINEIENYISDFEGAINNIEESIGVLKNKKKSIEEHVSILKDKIRAEEKKCEIKSDKEEKLIYEMAKEINKESKKVIQLKNGQSNIKFSEKIDRSLFGIPENVDISFDGISCLSWNNKNSIFEGEPLDSGEYIGTFTYWMDEKDEEEGKPPIEKKVHFLVNPDPRSLWQNIDPPESAPYYKNNQDFDVKVHADRKVIGVSVRGKSHAHKGTFRDDHYAVELWEKQGWVLQVVADGAGTAEFSRKGSEIACNETVKEIDDFINSEKLDTFEILLENYYKDQKDENKDQIGINLYNITVGTAFNANKAINKFALDEGYEIKKFATTLLFALSKKFDFGTIVITFSVGDGAIGVISKDNADMLMKPDGGEFSGQTRFLTMSEIFKPKDPNQIKERYSIKCYKDEITSIILMTDGISDPKFGTDNNLNDSKYWKNLWDELKPVLVEKELEEKSMYEWMNFYMQGEYDDRTISVLY